jgi:RNA-directed DNA polymerase
MELTPAEASHGPGGEAQSPAARHVEWNTSAAIARRRAQTSRLMEQVIEPDNLNQAYQRVLSNKGSPGVDGMSVGELAAWIGKHKQEFIGSLLDGSYQPSAVKGVKIPKPGGGQRQLGIPTVIDRLVQQAMLQVLTPILDPRFSESSYGFRPGRSAHDALFKAREHVAEGYGIVVDMDLEKFFDRVNHDVLMNRLGRHVGDKRMLAIIGRFLRAGLMSEGVCEQREEGTPQGGPLSPLLSNLMLDDLDKELEKRGHRFCRYADDCNIYVQSMKAGERVMTSVSKFLTEKLKLRVNPQKSAVAPVNERKFLGYRLLRDGRLGMAPGSLKRARERL